MRAFRGPTLHTCLEACPGMTSFGLSRFTGMGSYKLRRFFLLATATVYSLAQLGLLQRASVVTTGTKDQRYKVNG